MTKTDHHETAAMAARVAALEAVLASHHLVDPAALDGMIQRFLDRARPENGARVVARAWVDAGFRARLLADATEAIKEMGFDMARGFQPWVRLRAVENDDRVHNLVVCTLCSCYPMALLGPPPGWYKSEAYRSRAVLEPRTVLGELGVEVDDGVEVRVWDSTSELRYLVVPQRPPGTDGFDEESLAALVPRDSLVGAATARLPAP